MLSVFYELQFIIGGMVNKEAFSTFLASLATHIQEQVDAHGDGN